MSATDTSTLRLERTFDASADDVFDAWTNPEVLRRWWKVEPDGTVPIAEVDLREGGSYRLAMHNPGSEQTHTVRGRYIQVSRPELLEYTWAWEEQDGSIGHESTVRVHFRQRRRPHDRRPGAPRSRDARLTRETRPRLERVPGQPRAHVRAGRVN